MTASDPSSCRFVEARRARFACSGRIPWAGHRLKLNGRDVRMRLDHGMDFIAFLGSSTGFLVTLDARFDLVQCDGAPDTNVPCNWSRVEGFKGPSE